MKKLLITSSVLLLLASSFTFKKVHSGGEVGTTGSPGEGTCTGCHGGGAAGTSISITAIPAFINNTYEPTQVYTLNVTVAHATQPAFGFDCEILATGNVNAGVMSSAGSGMQFFTTGGRKNATHTTPKTGSGSATWTFVWTAPATGNATIFVSGNAVNQNSNTGGDSPTNTNLALTPDLTAGLKQNSLPVSDFRFFPNPAADICTFSYQLQYDAEVNVDLYEIGGKMIKHLLSEKQSAGAHQQIVDLKTVSKGIYFARVTVNGERQIQRLISVQ